MTRLSLALALSLAACNSAGQYPSLAEAEQQAFMGCWRQVGGGFCGPHSLDHMDCRSAYQARYAERPIDERPAYLGELGCAMPAVDAAPLAETAGSEDPDEVIEMPARDRDRDAPTEVPPAPPVEPDPDPPPEAYPQNDAMDAT